MMISYCDDKNKFLFFSNNVFKGVQATIKQQQEWANLLNMAKSTVFSVLLPILLSSITCNATVADDEKDCADQLQNLAACIPYVSGAAKKPTPECCVDAEKVRSRKPKCLCVLIVESADPSPALPINTTLALQTPAACNSDAKVSDCPDILKLSPDSPDANIFEGPSGDSSKAIAPATSSTAAASSNSTPASADATIASKNNAGRLESVFLSTLSMASMSCNLLFYRCTRQMLESLGVL